MADYPFTKDTLPTDPLLRIMTVGGGVAHTTLPVPSDLLTGIGQLGGGIDFRKLAKWFFGGIANKLVVWWGDSTTQQLTFSNIITYVPTAWTPKYMAQDLADAGVQMIARGSNGASLQFLATATSAINTDGVDCSLPAIAALKADAVVIGLTINDCRQDASIAGSTYGNAAQIAKATSLRALLGLSYRTIKAQNPNTIIIWRVPNAHKSASIYFGNGVTGQNAMDVYRLTFMGDRTTSLTQSLDEIYPDSICYDTLASLYPNTVVSTTATTTMLDADGFHPTIQGYRAIIGEISRLLSRPFGASFTSNTDSANIAAGIEGTRAHGPVLPRSPYEVLNSGEWVPVTSGLIGTNNSNATNLSIDPTAVDGPTSGAGSGAAISFGGTSGAYAVTSPPSFCLGDILVFLPTDGSGPYIERVARAPDDVSGPTLRWYTGPINGRYLNGVIPNLTPFKAYRNKYAGSRAARTYDALRKAGGNGGATALKNMYRVVIVAPALGSVTLRPIPYPDAESLDFSTHTLTTSDVLCVTGLWSANGIIPSIPLTGATFGAGTNPGEQTITLAGFDFRGANIPQAIVFSAT